MKKFLGIVVLGLLFCGNAYAGLNEVGSCPISLGMQENNKKNIYIQLLKVIKTVI